MARHAIYMQDLIRVDLYIKIPKWGINRIIDSVS